MSLTTIETVSGRLIDLENIDSSLIDIHDIAWALSRIPRFAGHSITIVPYNVSQHSICVFKKVLEWVETRVEFITWDENDKYILLTKALLHDGAEYLTNDLPSPIKWLPGVREVIKEVELRIDNAINARYSLFFSNLEYDEICECIIKEADLYCRKIEAYTFIYSRGKNWPGMPEVSFEELQNFNQPLTSIDAYREFINYFENIGVD